MSIRDVMVIGAGAAGSGIAQVCAQHDMTVCLVDVKEEQLTRARYGTRSNPRSLRMPFCAWSRSQRAWKRDGPFRR